MNVYSGILGENLSDRVSDRMKTTKLIAVKGSGLIGMDPYEENAWSGFSRSFFKECDRQGILHRAFGVELENAYRIPLSLSNVWFNRAL